MPRKKSKKVKKQKEETTEPSGSINEQLDEVFEEAWDDVDPKSFDELVDGNYETRVLAALLNNSKTSGRFQCSWEAIVLGGESKGRHIFKHDGLDTGDGLAYFQGNLAKLGYEKPKSKKALIKLLEEIVDAPTYVLIRLSTRRRKVEGEIVEIQNKRFIRALDSDSVDDEFEEDELTSTMGVVDMKEDNWSKGDEVQTDIDGTTYSGVIKSIDEEDQTARVLFEDGDKLDIPLDDLEEVSSNSKGGTDDIPFEKSDRVEVEIDGTDYAGKIQKIKGDSATIEFDDGDVEKHDLSELTKLEEHGDKEELPPCSLPKGEKLTSTERRTVNKFAKDDEFEPDHYDSRTQLLCEIGDYHGLSGKFKSAAALIKAIKKAIEEED